MIFWNGGREPKTNKDPSTEFPRSKEESCEKEQKRSKRRIRTCHVRINRLTLSPLNHERTWRIRIAALSLVSRLKYFVRREELMFQEDPSQHLSHTIEGLFYHGSRNRQNRTRYIWYWYFFQKFSVFRIVLRWLEALKKATIAPSRRSNNTRPTPLSLCG